MEIRFVLMSLLGLSSIAVTWCGCDIEPPEGSTGVVVSPAMNYGFCQDRPTIPSCGSGDIADKDYDRDGLANCADPDIDGDGITNDEDCAPFYALSNLSLCDNSDLAMKDYDKDGLANCQDPDIDGDGIPNEEDGDPYHKTVSATE